MATPRFPHARGACVHGVQHSHSVLQGALSRPPTCLGMPMCVLRVEMC